MGLWDLSQNVGPLSIGFAVLLFTQNNRHTSTNKL